jgi:hypothetical protein
LIERENLLFVFQCYKMNLRISQSPEVLIQINYKKKNSLSRLSVEIEKSWFIYLQTFDKDYARNFSIESARNFVRRKDYNSAKQILHLNQNPNLTTKTFYFFVLLLSMIRRGIES